MHRCCAAAHGALCGALRACSYGLPPEANHTARRIRDAHAPASPAAPPAYSGSRRLRPRHPPCGAMVAMFQVGCASDSYALRGNGAHLVALGAPLRRRVPPSPHQAVYAVGYAPSPLRPGAQLQARHGLATLRYGGRGTPAPAPPPAPKPRRTDHPSTTRAYCACVCR